MLNFSADMMVTRLESLLQRELTEEEIAEIDLWQKGRALQQLIGLPGWEVLVATSKEYAQAEIRTLLNTQPGDTEKVMVNHAVAYGCDHMFEQFWRDIMTAVDASRRTPEVVKEAYRRRSEAPPPIT